MKNRILNLIFSFSFILLAITACGPKSKYTNRFDDYKVVNDENNSSVTISSFSLGVPAPASTTLLNLGERGQAEFIRAVKEYSKENQKDFIEILGSIINVAPQPPSILVDKTIFKRRIVFSIENTSEGPADRIEKAKIILTLDKNQNKPEFKNWDMFSSKYETIDLGTLQYKQSNVFGLTASGSVPLSSPVELSANAELSRDLQETILLKDRRIVSTGQLKPNQATVIQEGSVGIDLTGNMTLDVEIDVPNAEQVAITNMKNLFVNDLPNESKKVNVSRYYVQFPKCSECPITATVKIDYVLRRIKDAFETGVKSIAEGDDVVELAKGTAIAEEPLEIIPKSNLAFTTWAIVLLKESEGADNNKKMEEHFLHLDTTKIRFDNYKDAAEFFNWLNLTKSTRVAGRELKLGGSPLQKEQIPNLNIKRTIENYKTCDKTEAREIKCDQGSKPE